MKKETKLTIFSIIFGIIIGIISKYSNEVFGNSLYDQIFHSIDTITAGLFIWLVICYILASTSKNKWYSVLNVTLFLIFMMISYYSYCLIVLDYFPDKKIIFWSLMLIPCAILAYLVKKINPTKKIKIFYLVLGIIVIIIDAVLFGNLTLITIIFNVILLIIYIFALKNSHQSE